MYTSMRDELIKISMSSSVLGQAINQQKDPLSDEESGQKPSQARAPRPGNDPVSEPGERQDDSLPDASTQP